MEDGKYTFQLHEDGWNIEVLRYGEPWITIQQGHHAVFALMQHAALQRAPRAFEPTTQVIKNRTGVANADWRELFEKLATVKQTKRFEASTFVTMREVELGKYEVVFTGDDDPAGTQPELLKLFFLGVPNGEEDYSHLDMTVRGRPLGIERENAQCKRMLDDLKWWLQFGKRIEKNLENDSDGPDDTIFNGHVAALKSTAEHAIFCLVACADEMFITREIAEEEYARLFAIVEAKEKAEAEEEARYLEMRKARGDTVE